MILGPLWREVHEVYPVHFLILTLADPLQLLHFLPQQAFLFFLLTQGD